MLKSLKQLQMLNNRLQKMKEEKANVLSEVKTILWLSLILSSPLRHPATAPLMEAEWHGQ